MGTKLQSQDINNVVGVLLAGGLARRFGGGDKCLRLLQGQTLLDRVVLRARPQVGTLILNVCGNQERFANLGLDVIPDAVEGHLGPLAGVLTGMEWVQANDIEADWLVSFATDAPFFPLDMVQCLLKAVEFHQADIALATSNGRKHPVFAVWRVALARDLRDALENQGVRKVMAWVEQQKYVPVDFKAQTLDPFFNINTEDDLKDAEGLIVKESPNEEA